MANIAGTYEYKKWTVDVVGSGVSDDVLAKNPCKADNLFVFNKDGSMWMQVSNVIPLKISIPPGRSLRMVCSCRSIYRTELFILWGSMEVCCD